MRRRLSKKSGLIVALLVVFIFGGLVLFDDEAERGTMFERYSSLRAEPDGLLAFYELCKVRGRKVHRSKEPLFDLPTTGLLVIVEPKYDWGLLQGLNLPGMGVFDKKELKSIRQWIGHGGSLLVLGSDTNEIFEEFQLETATFGREANKDSDQADAGLFHPLTQISGAISVSSGARLLPKSPEWLPLFRSENGLVAAVRPLGRGQIIALSDPEVISNKGLVKGSNAEFIGQVLSCSEGVVIFDEMRHGLTMQQNAMSYARKHSLHFVFFQGLAVFLLLWWASSAQAGRIRAPQPASGIESREFLSALASIYQKAHLHGHAIAWFERRLVLLLRHLLADENIKRFEDLDQERVSEYLKNSGIKNYQGFSAYCSVRKALLRQTDEATKGRWAMVKYLPENEIVAFIRLAIRLEHEWLKHTGLYTGLKLLQDAPLLITAEEAPKTEESEPEESGPEESGPEESAPAAIEEPAPEPAAVPAAEPASAPSAELEQTTTAAAAPAQDMTETPPENRQIED